MQTHYSLYELNQYIRQAVALNFEEAVWIEAEIAQISFSGRHAYLDLWQKDADTEEIMAQSGAVIWADKLSFVKKKLNSLFHDILSPGINVLIKVKPDFHERYGLKLVIQDLDPSFTIGQLALKKEEALRKLRQENLVDRNAQLPLASVIQRIAVMSSETSAGYQDFMEQLYSNDYGYDFDVTLYPISVQGVNVSQDLGHQMGEIHLADRPYDLIVIIRGGGSKMDLAAFDEYDTAKIIALSDIPVLTGIGHERDDSLCDLVSQIRVKTPTAAADHIVQYNLSFEQAVYNLFNEISDISWWYLNRERSQLESIAQNLHNMARNRIRTENYSLSLQHQSLNHLIQSRLTREAHQIDRAAAVVQERDPIHILKRGYSMTVKGDTVIMSPSQLSTGDIITTTVAKGDFTSKVN